MIECPACHRPFSNNTEFRWHYGDGMEEQR